MDKVKDLQSVFNLYRLAKAHHRQTEDIDKFWASVKRRAIYS